MSGAWVVLAGLVVGALGQTPGDAVTMTGDDIYTGLECLLISTPNQFNSTATVADFAAEARDLGIMTSDCTNGLTSYNLDNTTLCPVAFDFSCNEPAGTVFTTFIYFCPSDALEAQCGSSTVDDVLMVFGPTFGVVLGAFFFDADGNSGSVGDGAGIVVGETQTQTQTQTATHSESATQSMTPSHSQTPVPTQSAPGSVGDPILIDFSGHRFMGGARGRTEYLLYRSHDETEAITMTTGVVQGKEVGYFAVAVGVQRAGCGSLQVAAGPEHKAEINGDACMTARIARGDEGLVLVPIGEGGDAGSVLAVYPHQHGDSPAFLNMRLLATTPAFRAGCTGMLCNEAHEDVVA